MALADTVVPHEIDAFLNSVLDGCPVICDPRNPRYYALVPASMPRTYREKADFDDWRAMDVDVLGSGTLLGYHLLDAEELDAATRASYWSVPMASAGVLCRPLLVGRLIGAGREKLDEGLDA